MGQAIGLLTAPIDIENLGYKIAGKAWCTRSISGTMSFSGLAISLADKTNISYAKIYITSDSSVLTSDPETATFIQLLYFGASYTYNGYRGTLSLTLTNLGGSGGLIISASNFQYVSSPYSAYIGAVFYA